jgi:excisionase family DNA binding protein
MSCNLVQEENLTIRIVNPMNIPKMLTVYEVAEHLRVNHNTVRRLINEKKLKAVRIGNAIRIQEPDLAEYLCR